jgi:hypothetical protein
MIKDEKIEVYMSIDDVNDMEKFVRDVMVLKASLCDTVENIEQFWIDWKVKTPSHEMDKTYRKFILSINFPEPGDLIKLNIHANELTKNACYLIREVKLVTSISSFEYNPMVRKTLDANPYARIPVHIKFTNNDHQYLFYLKDEPFTYVEKETNGEKDINS